MNKQQPLNHHWRFKGRTNDATEYTLTWSESASAAVRVVMKIPLRPYIQAPAAVINVSVVDAIWSAVEAILEQKIPETP